MNNMDENFKEISCKMEGRTCEDGNNILISFKEYKNLINNLIIGKLYVLENNQIIYESEFFNPKEGKKRFNELKNQYNF